MVLGALIIEAKQSEELRSSLDEVRRKYGLQRELKWGKVSSHMLEAYQAYTLTTIKSLKQMTPGYYAIVIDTSKLDHLKFNGGDREIGFSKFVYQLIIKCARLFHYEGCIFDVFMDERTTRQTLTEFRSILNNGMNKGYGVRPFRRVEYRDSRECNLVQAVDLFTGAVAYHCNLRHEEPGASPARIMLAESIATAIGKKNLAVQTSSGRDRFSLWHFAGQKGRPNGPRGR